MFIDKIIFDAERFKEIDVSADEVLPNKSVPFIWYFVKKLHWPLLTILICYTIGTAFVALEPVFFGQIVGAIAEGEKETLWQELGVIIGLYLFLIQLVARAVWQFGHHVESHTYPLLTMLVRRQLSVYLHRHSYKFFQDDYAGRLAGKVVEMPEDVTATIEAVLLPILFNVITGIVSLCIFATAGWPFAIVTFVFFVLSMLHIRWRLPLVYKSSEIFAEKLNNMRGRFIDSVSNVLLVKLFSRQKFEDSYFTDSLIKSGKSEQAKKIEFLYLCYGQHIINALFMGAVAIISVEGYRQDLFDLKTIATAFPLGALICMNMWWLLQTFTHFFSRFAVIQESLNTIIQDHEVKDADDATELKLKTPKIHIRNIGFSFPNLPLFKNFSLDIPANQRIGLVGPSGAGKSSLVQLILRLFDLNDGQIIIDGQDISQVTQESLRNSISVIPQTTDLMHRSIYENIVYGRPEATREEVIEAAKKAHIHDVVMEQEDKFGNKGYEAVVGERGVKLSGGQRQRIAIARAFLKDAPILLLDEATSALDSESERLIQESLITLMKGRTVLVIAHRLSTISHLNRIVVMKEGKIIEDGDHKSLLRKEGMYAKLWNLQSAGFIGDV